MNNEVKSYIYHSASAMSMMFVTGSIMQGFLLDFGATNNQVYVYETILNVMQVLSLFLSIFIIDKIKRLERLMAIDCILFIPLLLIVMVSQILGKTGNTIYYLLLSFGIISFLSYGFRSAASYRIPYQIHDMKKFGAITAWQGIFAGITGFVISMLYTFVLKKFNNLVVNVVFLSLAIICFIIAAVTLLRYKINKAPTIILPSKRFNTQVFKNKRTYLLLIPTLLRGICSIIIGFYAVMATTLGIIDTKSLSILVVLAQVATFLGNFTFTRSIKKIKTSIILLIGGICLAVLMPLSLIWHNAIIFFAFYFFVVFFRAIVDTGVPVIVTEFIPYEQIGAFSSIRMMTHVIGHTVGGVLMATIDGVLPYVIILVIAAASIFICTTTYSLVGFFSKNLIRQTSPTEPIEDNAEKTIEETSPTEPIEDYAEKTIEETSTTETPQPITEEAVEQSTNLKREQKD